MTTAPAYLGQNTTIPVFFFYGDGCSHCDSVKPLLADVSRKYPDLDIRMLEIYHNVTNQELFFQMSQKYGIEKPGIPELVIGDRMLVGDTDIKAHFEERVLEEQQKVQPCNLTPATPVLPVSGCPPETTQLTVPLVIISAMVDSINPCAFSVLIFLLISLVAAGDRRRTLLVGSVYIAAVFFFYLLSGIGLFSAIHLTGLSLWLSLIGALVAIGLGLIGVIDALIRKEGFVLGIPESKKAVIEDHIKRASLPAAFTLGILVGIFELPCTGGIYLAILGLISRDMTLMQGLPYLLLYNIVFVLPLILIVLVVTFGVSPDKADAWRIRHRRTLRLFVGLVMIAIGLIILRGWFG